MEENIMLPLKDFLQKYGFDESNLTTKEKLKILKQIYLTNDVASDWEELKYSKMTSEGENNIKELESQFITKMDNLDIEKCNIQRYIGFVKTIQKEERRVKRKENLQKLLKPKTRD